MSCILRASGRRFDVERYVARSPFRAVAVHHRGAPVFPASQPRGRTYDWSSCNIEVSRRGFHEFAAQVRDAIRFLKANAAAVRALRRFPGVESVALDFGVAWREVAVHSDALPQEVVELAGRCHLTLAISHYRVKTDEGERRGGRLLGAATAHNHQTDEVRAVPKPRPSERIWVVGPTLVSGRHDAPGC